jgi:hypothetical protein
MDELRQELNEFTNRKGFAITTVQYSWFQEVRLVNELIEEALNDDGDTA